LSTSVGAFSINCQIFVLKIVQGNVANVPKKAIANIINALKPSSIISTKSNFHFCFQFKGYQASNGHQTIPKAFAHFITKNMYNYLSMSTFKMVEKRQHQKYVEK